MESYYWAAEPQETVKTLVTDLNDKCECFQRTFKSTEYARRLARNHRYYHGQFYKSSSADLDLDIKSLGEEGEYIGVAVNQFRSLIHHVMILTTGSKPVWDTRAVNTDPESLQQAKLGNHVLDYYMTFLHVEDYLRMAVEHSLVYNVGYLLTTWDFSGGPEVNADPETGEVLRAGDVTYSNPTIYDVVFDPTAKSWDKVQWVRVREWVNRWDLVAKFPERKEEIVDQDDWVSDEEYTNRSDTAEFDDLVATWRFWHKATPSLPRGRYTYTFGELAFEDGVNNEPQCELPIDRVTPGEYLGNCFGYSPANDIQSLQEAYNAELSSILSGHKALGVQLVWVQTGSNITVEDLKGLTLVQSDTKPEALNLVNTPAEIQQMPEVLGSMMEQTVGINSVARGQPEANLKSGTALALIDAKAQQAVSYLQAGWYKLIEGSGTKTIRNLAKFGGTTERLISIVGRFNKAYVDSFKGSDLTKVDRVIVQSGNAMSKTPSGKVQIAQDLLQSGLIKTPEEYIQVITTGQLESMLEADSNELALIREENARLLRGEPVQASPLDNQMLHIREHHSILGSQKTREDPLISTGTLAHILDHALKSKDPAVQELQVLLGYTVALPPSVPPGSTMGPSNQKPNQPAQNPEGNPEGRPEAQAQLPRPAQPPSPAMTQG